MKKLISFLSITFLSLFVIAGCTSNKGVKIGDTISVAYTANFSDGQVFEQHTEQTPLVFTIGSGQVVPGLDSGVVGMKVGTTKTFTVAPDKGYGNLYDANGLQKISKFIFDKLNIIPTSGTVQKIGDISGVIKGTETDGSGNIFVLFDINPRQTWDILTYKVTVLKKN